MFTEVELRGKSEVKKKDEQKKKSSFPLNRTGSTELVIVICVTILKRPRENTGFHWISVSDLLKS